MTYDSPDYDFRAPRREEHEGRKQVILFDNFEATRLKPIPSMVVGGSVRRSFDTAHSGEACLRFETGVTSGAWAKASYMMGLPYSKVILVECYHCFYPPLDAVHLRLELRWYQRLAEYDAGVLYDRITEKWYYSTAPDVFVEIPDSDQKLRLGVSSWHHFLLAVDFEKLKYLSLKSDNLLLDLTQFQVHKTTVPRVYEMLVADFTFKNTNGAAGRLWYVDDILFAEAWRRFV